ncbi:Innexin unc-9 [Trichinella sp. T6]|nr:Innexin unc-9 [Trichinella sp. T6]
MFILSSFLKALKPQYDDDTIDRINYYYTCLILIILAATISAKQYVGQPIQCWVPAQFSASWEQYAENYCFVQNTYWLYADQQIPTDLTDRYALQIGYYQWVPFVLAIQAALFYLPCLIWRLLNWQSGFALRNVIGLASEWKNNNAYNCRRKFIQTIANYIEDSIQLQNCHGKNNPTFKHGYRITVLYLSIKFAYLINAVGQLFLLNGFLAPKYQLWGVAILVDLINGHQWQWSGHFPRVTLCDFEVRLLGNLHRYSIQCVLMINMFNEWAFLFLWWWLVFVATATACNTLGWMSLIFSKRALLAFVTRYAKVMNADDNRQRWSVIQQNLHTFTFHHLRVDGVLVMKMLSLHAGNLITADVIWTILENYLNKITSKID